MEEPLIDEADLFYLTGFWDLNTTRQFDMGFIPWNAKLQYANYHELDALVTEGFMYLVGNLDHVYLDWLAREREKK